LVVKFQNPHFPSALELAEALKSHMIIFKPRRHTRIFQLHACTAHELPPQAEHTPQSVTTFLHLLTTLFTAAAAASNQLLDRCWTAQTQHGFQIFTWLLICQHNILQTNK